MTVVHVLAPGDVCLWQGRTYTLTSIVRDKLRLYLRRQLQPAARTRLVGIPVDEASVVWIESAGKTYRCRCVGAEEEHERWLVVEYAVEAEIR